MKFLLDTGIVLWSVAQKERLNDRAAKLLSSGDSDLYLSAAAAWEIAIKYSLGALKLHTRPEIFIPEVIRGMRMQALHITHLHAVEAGQLPRHHRDPFDRMLIAQATREGLVLLTADRVFEKYEVEQIYCGR